MGDKLNLCIKILVATNEESEANSLSLEMTNLLSSYGPVTSHPVKKHWKNEELYVVFNAAIVGDRKGFIFDEFISLLGVGWWIEKTRNPHLAIWRKSGESFRFAGVHWACVEAYDSE